MSSAGPVWSWGLRASGFLERGLPRQALALLNRGPASCPGWALLLRSRAKQALGREDLAEADVTRAFDRDPRCSWVFGLPLWPGDIPKTGPARRLYEANRSFREQPGGYAVRAFVGKLKVMAGRRREGLADMDRAVRESPGRAYLWAWRAEARRRCGDAAGAWRDVRRALALDPRQAVAYSTRAALKRLRGDPKGALEDAALSARLLRHYEIAALEAGRACLDLRDGRGLLLWLGRAARRAARLGWQSLRPARAGGREHEEFQWLLRLPALQAPRWRARLLAWRGEAALGRGDAVAAVEFLRRALSYDPDHAWALAWLGEALDLRGRPEEALRSLDRALGLDPSYARAWIARGRLRLASGQPRPAWSDFNQGLGLEPDWAWARYWRARSAMALGLKEEARRDLEGALRLDPGFADSRSLLMSLSSRASA